MHAHVDRQAGIANSVITVPCFMHVKPGAGKKSLVGPVDYIQTRGTMHVVCLQMAPITGVLIFLAFLPRTDNIIKLSYTRQLIKERRSSFEFSNKILVQVKIVCR